MKKAICFLFLIICTSNLFSQTKIEDYLEGRKFKNAQTGLVLQYGYISSLNTNGITYTNGYGDKFYFMNCSKRISSDETYMVLTECMNPQNGSGLGTIYAYRTKVIVKASDGQLQYDLVGESDFSTQSQNKEEKESKSTKSFCAYDIYKSKYELNLNEDAKTLTYKKYDSDGNLLQTLYGTYQLRDEGVYGPALKVVASISGNTMKWLVIIDGFGNTQELKDESAGRVWSPCTSRGR